MFLGVKVITNAAKNQIIEKSVGELIVKITTTPVRGKANKKLIELLAEYFDVKKSDILIVKGKYNSKKVVNVINR